MTRPPAESPWLGWWLHRAAYQTIIRMGVVTSALLLIHHT